MGLIGSGGCHERGATSFAAVPIQRELRYNKHLLADISKRLIHFSVFIGKDAQMNDFIHHPFTLSCSVFVLNTQEYQQPRSDRTDGLLINPHRRLADPLNNRPHCEILL